MKKIKVLLVDDQKLFVDNLKTVLDLTTNDIEVVGIAYNGKEAVKKVEELQPEVVLLDVRMPIMDGVESTRILRQKYPGLKILVLTTFDDDDYVHDALKYGANGYILKKIPPPELFSCIRTLSRGGVIISPEIAHKVVEWEEKIKKEVIDESEEKKWVKALLKSLSIKEKDIINQISLAYSNKQIAANMFLSEQTIKNYISQIYSKLGVSKRSELMRLCYKLEEDEILRL